jgi:phosphate transport system protein
MAVHLEREIEKLKRNILSLSALVEESVRNAVKSIEDRDAELAEKVIEDDLRVDRAEIEVEEDCLKILALYQPVAIDLRFVIAVIKINNDLERIGDLSVNIAERAVDLAQQKRTSIPFDFTDMSHKAQTMLKKSLDALVNMDTTLAHDVRMSDDEVDAIHRRMYAEVENSIRRDPDRAESLIELMGVSQNLERIADHATNIAEDVIYMIDGEIVRHRKAQTETWSESGIGMEV